MSSKHPAPRESVKAAKRREQVLSAAAECFRREGFHGSSMSRIAAEAGMSPGHVFHYFKRKEEIVEAIVARERTELDALAAHLHAAGPGDPASAILAHADDGIDRQLDGDRNALSMEILAEAARNPEVARIIADYDTGIRQTILALLGGDPASQEARWEILAALFEGLGVRALRNPGTAQTLDRDMLKRVIRFLLEA